MPKRSRKKPTVTKLHLKKQPAARAARDENQMAYNLVQHVEEMGARLDGKNPMAVALGRLGGLKGGKARAEKLTVKQRRASAAHAAKVRWSK